MLITIREVAQKRLMIKRANQVRLRINPIRNTCTIDAKL
jgi:hypothetical protein